MGGVLSLLVAVSLSAAPVDPLSLEATRRSDALVQQGYNLTHGFTFEARPEKSTARFEFIVPEEHGEHAFSFWAEIAEGELTYRLVGTDGKPVATASGRRLESTVTRAAPVGKYAVELELPAGKAARAQFGVKGPVLHECETGPLVRHPAAPEKGFHWPYLVRMPKELKSSRLLVLPNNSGFATDDVEFLQISASCELKRRAALGDRLGVPLLVPLFPRPALNDEENLYLHALTRSSLETKIETWRRVDLQLLAMIDDARASLKDAEPKVLLWGFSASGSFVNRFAVLHPDRVAAVASGSPGGWPIAPVAEVEREALPWPVGVADLTALTGAAVDLPALKRVAFFFFLGDQDANDAVPHRDSFSKADEELIFRRFGKTPVSRWKSAERLYSRAGLTARFKLYPGVGHAVTAPMDEDVALFFETANRP